MLPQCSHITRKRGCYYYRRRLPKPFTGEIALSLRTRAFREAEWLADQLDNAFVRVLRNMTETTESRADIAAIATKHLRESLEFDLKIRQARATRPPLSDWEKWSTSIYAVDEELDKAKAELAGRGHPERHDDYIDWFAEQNNVPADQRNELAFAILRANVAKWEIIRRRTLGDPAAFEEARVVEASPVTAGPTALAVPKGPLFLEVLPGFIEYMQQTEGWRGQTLAQNKTTYRMFVECCGDRPVNEYQRIDFAKFYDVLRALPKLYAKSQEWRGLPLAEIAAQTKERELPRLSIRTVKRHSTAMGRLFSNLKKRGEITGENPAHGHDFPKKGRTRSGRSMWSGEMLKKLFASPVWTGCLSEARRSLPGERIIKDEKYWLPLLGVYHGNRLEEFAQLRRSDVRQENDIWFLDINDEGNKQVKNEQSKRRVPLHPELKRLGFLEYVEGTAPNPTDPVFPELQPGGADNKLGFYFTKWFSRYRTQVGVYQQGLDYHSFRASVATKLAEAGVALEVRNELLGHEGKSIDEQNYQKGFSLKFLAEAISKVSWPEIDL